MREIRRAEWEGEREWGMVWGRARATGNCRMTIVNCLNKIYECPNVSPYNFMHFNIKFITICVRIFLWLLPSIWYTTILQTPRPAPHYLNSLCAQLAGLTIQIPCKCKVHLKGVYSCGKRKENSRKYLIFYNYNK